MWSDNVKAEAIARLAGEDKAFIMTDGDLESIKFPDDPEFPAISVAKLEAMCEEVQKEIDLEKKYAPPPMPDIQKQLEYLWHDLNNNSLNKGGTFYKVMMPYFNK